MQVESAAFFTSSSFPSRRPAKHVDREVTLEDPPMEAEARHRVLPSGHVTYMEP